MSSDDRPDSITEWRLEALEKSVLLLAEAAQEQVQFNAAVRTWGKVGLILYGTTQSVGLVLLAYAASQLSGGA